MRANRAYLSRETIRHLSTWLEGARIKEGAISRRHVGRHQIGERLNVDAIAQAPNRVAAFIGMPPNEVDQISGHSIRVGATQDLLALNIDLASVMQAGRWKTKRMPMRYGEHAQPAALSRARL
jgi:integrase